MVDGDVMWRDFDSEFWPELRVEACPGDGGNRLPAFLARPASPHVEEVKAPTLDGMDQEKAGNKHYHAGKAMNGERLGLRPTRTQNGGHVAQRNNGQHE